MLPNQYISKEESKIVAQAVTLANLICHSQSFYPYFGIVSQFNLTINETYFNFLAVEVTQQNLIDWPTLREKIGTDYFNNPNAHYIQAIGDRGGWTDNGASFFNSQISTIYSTENNVLLFGTTSDVGEGFNAVNNIVTQQLVDNTALRSRTIGNVIDQTVQAINEWNYQAPASLALYWYVYSNNGTTYFGNDTISSDWLAHTTISGGGNAEVLLQDTHTIAQGKSLKVINNINLPAEFDGKPLFVASNFTCAMQQQAQLPGMTSDKMLTWATSWINNTAWQTNSNDNNTKPAVLEQAFDSLFGQQEAWKNVDDSVTCLSPETDSFSNFPWLIATLSAIGGAVFLTMIGGFVYCYKKYAVRNGVGNPEDQTAKLMEGAVATAAGIAGQFVAAEPIPVNNHGADGFYRAWGDSGGGGDAPSSAMPSMFGPMEGVPGTMAPARMIELSVRTGGVGESIGPTSIHSAPAGVVNHLQRVPHGRDPVDVTYVQAQGYGYGHAGPIRVHTTLSVNSANPALPSGGGGGGGDGSYGDSFASGTTGFTGDTDDTLYR